MTNIEFIQENQVGIINFYEENPTHPCTLDHRVLDKLDEILDSIYNNKEEIRVVLVKSSSTKFFIVGANIKALQELNSDNIVDWVKKGHNIFNRIESLGIPVIAVIDGYALGGGLELAMACDMIFATKKSKFGQPEASLGVIPGWGGSYRLPKKIGLPRAKELFFTGKVITASEAYGMGLVNHVAEDENELSDLINKTVEDIKKNDRLAVSYIKQIVNNSVEGSLMQNKFDEATASSVCMNSETTKKRLYDFFEQRKNK